MTDLSLEPLEGRRVLAVTFSQDSTTGAVTFTGDGSQDTLTFTMPSAVPPAVAPATKASITLNWAVNGASQPPITNVTDIKFTDGGNNDTLAFDGQGAVAVLLDGQNIVYGGSTPATSITVQTDTVPALTLSTLNTGSMKVGGSGFVSVTLKPGAGVLNAAGFETNDLVIDGFGTFSLTDAGNKFGTVTALARTSGAAISIRDADGFRVDGIAGAGGATVGPVVLVSGGDITQAGAIVSTTLRADTSPGSGSINLTDAANDFAALSAASNTGNIDIVSSTATMLTIGVGSQGIDASGGAVSVKAASAAIAIGKPVKVVGGSVMLTADQGISTSIPQSVADAITASSLSLVNNAFGTISLGVIDGSTSTPRMAVGSLSAINNSSGNISARNSGALSLGGNGLSVTSGNVGIQSDSISIDASIGFGSGTVTLKAAGGISQTALGTISDGGSGGTLIVAAAGSNISVTNTSGIGNQVTKFNATTTGGNVQYTSSGPVTIAGVSAGGGNIELRTVNAGNLNSVGASITTIGSGTITLATDVGGNITTGAISAGTGPVLLQTSVAGSSIDTSAATISTGGGDVSLKLLGTGGTIVTGAVSTAGGSQSLTTVNGSIDATAGTLSSGGGGVTLLTGTGGVMDVGSVTSSGGSQSFTSGAAFTLATGTTLSSGGGSITITAKTAGGSIATDASTLISSGGGAIRLDAAATGANAISLNGDVSANTTGRITLASSGGIDDNAVAKITAGQLVVERSNAPVTLVTATNSIGALDLVNTSTGANKIVSGSPGLTIGVAGLATHPTPGITTAGGDVSIDVAGNAITAISTAVISMGSAILTLEASSIDLAASAHSVAKLAANASDGGISFKAAGNLSVVSGTGATGSTVDGLTASAPNAVIALTAAGVVSQDTTAYPAATIQATTGQLTVSAAKISLTNPANDVLRFQGNSDGDIDYVDATGVSIGINGLAGAPNKAGGVSIEAGDTIGQFASVYASSLTALSGGSVTLGDASNDVDTFIAASGPSGPAPVGIIFADANDVALGDVLADGTDGNGGYVIVQAGGSIAVNGELTYDTATPGSLVLQHGSGGSVDFVVTSPLDLSDPTDLTSAALALTLRQRINYLNDNAVIAPQNELISFQINNFFPITIDTQLPTIERKVTIGPASSAITAPDYRIAIDGSTAVNADDSNVAGLTFGFGNAQGLGSNGSTIQGLTIYGFSGSGIVLNSSGNTVTNNWIGITRGSEVKANGVGIEIVSSLNLGTTELASSNTIDGNVVSGNSGAGILVRDQSTLNVITNNLIGTNQFGTIPIGNLGYGIEIASSNLNTVGGVGQGNTIVNNAGGIKISGSLSSGSDFLANKVLGNTIRNNSGDGIAIDTSIGNVIGGSGAGNSILDNTIAGISITGARATSRAAGNVVQANTISLNRAGGIVLDNTAFQSISGGNVLTSNGNFASNTGAGITIRTSAVATPATDNFIGGNFIGSDASAATDGGNAAAGIQLDGAVNTVIGSALSGDANTIAYNRLDGVFLSDTSVSDGEGGFLAAVATGNRIQGNTIRFNNTLGSTYTAGVSIVGGNRNLVGGSGAGEGNTISNNRAFGVTIGGPITINGDSSATYASYADGNRVAGNTIASNELDGISISSTNFQSVDSGNVVTSNGRDGISLSNGASNRIVGNRIGIDATGLSAGNERDGIRIDGSTAAVIGDVAAPNRNIIAANGAGPGGGDGIHLLNGANDATIRNNLIGIDTLGAAVGNAGAGIRIAGTAGSGISGIVIGGAATNAGNVISGNDLSGVVLAFTTNAAIAGNRIGTNLAGDTAVANGGRGIEILGGSGGTIGGTVASAANVISGNARSGIRIDGGTGHAVVGNRIGTNPTATSSVGNQEHGVEIDGGATATIGGLAAGSANTIAGNIQDGVHVFSGTPAVLGNLIGTNAASAATLFNGGDGIEVEGGANARIGDGTAAGRNVVSGNRGRGVLLSGGTGATVSGNYIGTDVGGAAALANAAAGVRIAGAAKATISLGNLVAGNAGNGIELVGATTVGAAITGNRIGTNAAGTAALANAGSGVSLVNAGAANVAGPPAVNNQNRIGGTSAGEGNLIAGNAADGITIADSTNVLVAQNSIGLSGSGGPLGNVGSGVSLQNSTNVAVTYRNQIANNTYGVLVTGGSANAIGADAGQTNAGLSFGNTITKNSIDGIRIQGGATGTVVAANFIGTTSTNATNAGNAGRGITILSSIGNTVGGTASKGVAFGNLIVGNGSDGIGVLDSVAGSLGAGNVVLANEVSRNAKRGIAIDNSDFTTLGGSKAGDGNTVTLNAGHGIELVNDSDSNDVVGNFVGTNAASAQGLGNAASGIRIAGGLSSGNTVRGNRVQGNLLGIQLDGSVGNTVGSKTPGDANVVVLQKSHGISLLNAASQNTVAGNLIGTDAGASKLGNAGDGVNLAGSIGNLIGGDEALEGNTIRFNAFNGVNLVAATAPSLAAGNLVAFNTVSGNRGQGIRLFSSGFNTIGTDAAPNTIGQNVGSGVLLSTNSSSNLVQGNVVGGDKASDGNAGFGISVIGGATNTLRANDVLNNAAGGINVFGASGTAIGGPDGVDGNTISSNRANGVLLNGNATLTTIRSNTISGNTLNGIDIERSTSNVVGGVVGGAATGNTITGNGLDGVLVSSLSASTVVQSNTIGGADKLQNLGNGIQVARALGTLVGGSGAFEGNTVNANRRAGVRVVSVASRSADAATRVLGNTVSGAGEAGIVVSGSTRQIIGGTGDGEANVVSKNAIGIQLIGGTTGTTVSGNVVTGSTTNGISIIGSTDNTVTANEVHGNLGNGISVLRSLSRSLSTGNRIVGNAVGTDFGSTTGIGNAGAGIHVAGSSFTTISANVIGGNASGITLAAGSTSNQVTSNLIGTDATGADLGNTLVGVDINASTANSVGGGNEIRFNGIGVRVLNAAASSTSVGNVIAGNTISDNDAQGVLVSGGGKHTIGGTAAGAGNTITNNGSDGIALDASTGNLVRGNAIDANKSSGVSITRGSGNAIAFGNVISNSGGAGVSISGSSSNTIGGATAPAGNTISGNGSDGIKISSGSTSNSVWGNTVSNNTGAGVRVTGATSTGNLIGASALGRVVAGLGNSIFNNTTAGVAIDAAVRTQVFANLLSGNGTSLPAAGIVLSNNANQNPPTPSLTSATLTGPTLRTLQIAGSIGTAAGQVYVVEVFANGTDPASVQAATLLGRVSVRTGTDGIFSGSILLPASFVVSPGDLLTFTATSAVGNTSQLGGPLSLS